MPLFDLLSSPIVAPSPMSTSTKQPSHPTPSSRDAEITKGKKDRCRQ